VVKKEDMYRGMVGEHGSSWQPVALKRAQNSSGREKQREILLHHDKDAANYEATAASSTIHNKFTRATTTATTTDVTDCVGITDVSVILCTMRSDTARKCFTWRTAGEHENQ
jgi:hypothetical protein